MPTPLLDQMSPELVRAVFETLPVELTVIDANDEVVGWNQHEGRIFKRALTSMGLNFRDCHPKESLDKVEAIVQQMKEGKRDSATFWIDLAPKDGKPGRKVLIQFFALRGDDGRYLGCMECTQDVQMHRQLEGERRVLDGPA